MEAPSSFIRLPLMCLLPLIGPNEATVNYHPLHVPIVAAHLVDVGASPHHHINPIKPFGNPEDSPLLVNLSTEAKCLPGRVWRGIFNADFPDGRREPQVGVGAAIYAIRGPEAPPIPRDDTIPTHKLPHLDAFAHGVVHLLTPHMKVETHLIRAGYVRLQVMERPFCA